MLILRALTLFTISFAGQAAAQDKPLTAAKRAGGPGLGSGRAH